MGAFPVQAAANASAPRAPARQLRAEGPADPVQHLGARRVVLRGLSDHVHRSRGQVHPQTPVALVDPFDQPWMAERPTPQRLKGPGAEERAADDQPRAEPGREVGGQQHPGAPARAVHVLAVGGEPVRVAAHDRHVGKALRQRLLPRAPPERVGRLLDAQPDRAHVARGHPHLAEPAVDDLDPGLAPVAHPGAADAVEHVLLVVPPDRDDHRARPDLDPHRRAPHVPPVHRAPPPAPVRPCARAPDRPAPGRARGGHFRVNTP
ncbi:hypothetical protein Amir_4226 [Actinosynnema mirum DSM 43827]|uniref:Uncharacterized protein n=1 Tax=Actinosynnema mirum (strain ATCC 29888 / DSM 43827 / JCM 3225 / NBRC 14064 / NCIMB 13271 / NRRL B-12336 / IMRU 3971 / 101) TaxID=446462 RepID=C6WHG2_ACTMD|nr:hypothetical protein Amir_4226 [Actinosynnema mirum DSM 43827]